MSLKNVNFNAIYVAQIAENNCLQGPRTVAEKWKSFQKFVENTIEALN